MAKISLEAAREYTDRWALVNAHEVEELRRTPMATKLQQLNSLVASRHLFGTDPRRAEEAEEVRRRWAELRQVFGG